MHYNRIIKRLIDIILSFILIFCFSWFFIIIILLIKIFSGSPVFFLQKRVGQFGQEFTLYKFRSMKINTRNLGTHELKGDEITFIGKIIRRLKIDEFPQIINVLIGNMSFVGPRPSLTTQKVLIRLRNNLGVLSLKPGITGLAQIKKIDMSTPKFLSRIDQIYLKNQNVCFDLMIIFLTAIGKGLGDGINRKI